MDLIGKIINNRYEIIEKIGQGGMATVYKARCKVLNRHVAVKVLKEEYLDDAEFVKRFRDEAQSAGSLSHPNIVSIYDVGKEGNINFIIMELVDGKTLKEYILEHGTISPTKALKIAMQIASALEEAHAHHVIHRDIKPHNIILTKDLMVKVTDFGIAKITTNSTITSLTTTVGSVHYFSPEHAKGGYTDEKSDLYSLGIVMYEMVTGILPFDAETPVAVALKHIQEKPIEPIEIKKEIPRAVNSIIMKALEKNTSNRYQNASEMIKDIYSAIKYPNEEVPSIEELNKDITDKTQVVPIVGMAGLEKARQEEKSKRAGRLQNLDSDEEKLEMSVEKYVNDDHKEDVREGKRKRIRMNDSDEDGKQEDNKDEEEIDDNKKKNIKKIRIAIIVIVAILIIGSGIAVFNFVNTLNNKNKEEKRITAPKLIGMNFEEAVEKYKSEGIEIVETENRSFDREIPEGHIMYQSIDEGITLKQPIIEVTVSKGKPMVEIPDLEKKDYRVAKVELENEGLVVEIDQVINPNYAENTVIKSTPGKGETVPEGTKIILQVSKGNGKAKFSMPVLTNMTEAAARSIITEKGLILTKVKYSQDKTKQDGYVLEQSIAPNMETEEGSILEITVNKLAKSKTVTVSTSEILPKSTDDQEEKSYAVKVTASVDGIENNVYNGNHKLSDKEFNFVVNGYTTAKIKIYVDNKIVKEISVTF